MFEGLMRDVRASRGVIVCSNGWTKAARTRADEHIDIKLMSVEEAEEIDYSAIDPCPYCQILKWKTKGVVFWEGQFPLPLGGWGDYLHWQVRYMPQLRSLVLGVWAKRWLYRMMKPTSAGASASGSLKRTTLKPCL